MPAKAGGFTDPLFATLKPDRLAIRLIHPLPLRGRVGERGLLIPYRSFQNGLPAKLEHISADSITDENVESFYSYQR